MCKEFLPLLLALKERGRRVVYMSEEWFNVVAALEEKKRRIDYYIIDDYDFSNASFR
jgi:hypothetical protein